MSQIEKSKIQVVSSPPGIEGPGFFATAGYFITGNGAFFALALFHLAILAVFMPRRENFKLLLNLSDTEMDELDR